MTATDKRQSRETVTAASTVRELCRGDIRAVETTESGRLVGMVTRVQLGTSQSYVGVVIPGRASRTIIVGNDAAVFEHVPADVAREIRSAVAT